MKILVIFTGGTISTSKQDGFLSPDESRKFMLLERYRENDPQTNAEFEILTPYTILSENLSAENLNSLVGCVCENSIEDYDGIIVTHGTDTIQYSAAALAYALGDSLPVALVSSNYQLTDSRANGHKNFKAAVECIKQGRQGVFVPYLNGNGEMLIHDPLSLTRHGEMTDDLYSIKCSDKAEKVGPLGKYALTEHSGILNILCHPGDSYEYSLDNVRAIMLQPYHSGTLNTESKAFQRFCGKAAECNIPVFAVNIPGGLTYKSMKSAKALGIICLPPCGSIPAYMKLWIGLSLNKDIKSFMNANLCGEYMQI